METNPSHYGLPNKVQLKNLGNNQLAIVKVIKSRIIQKDAAKIVKMAQQIRSVQYDVELTLICTSNICSKSIALLESAGIDIQFK